jgi:hypothetical protein
LKNFLKNLFKKISPNIGKKIGKGLVTYYNIGGVWGDAINWTKYGDRTQVVGWKDRIPRNGDVLRAWATDATSENKKIALYQFINVKPMRDPVDGFFADTVYLGISDDQYTIKKENQ